MTRPERNKQQDLLDTLNNLLADIDPDTPEETDEVIRSAGIDPDAYAAKIEELAQNALAKQARLQIENARQKYDSRKTAQAGNRQSLIQQIQERMSQLSARNRMVFAHHRNLESASDADLQSLLDDLSFLVDSDTSSDQE